ncbi:DNA polymerase III subunit beta [Candidatus Moranella endobia PCVAL]|uniref:Beta sliding clamp n=1 Tax=Moranella endobia (strain PCIT) TaxID=903503 RepID=F7XX60_MOREP|nr:DNA polymerase III subunit beta [Candidatus Moranella endobia]AEI74686.1 DNA polymerase III, beta subunit [Candidatus Moranella endobia PCIT]AGJ61342.1 DNA polymerase III subunit beta [Candidatus Moranella endobia PCVAL]
MQFIVEREHLIKSIQQVSGMLVVRPTLPILSHVLLQVTENSLLITGTDLSIEIIARVVISNTNDFGKITVPARKFFDICRCMPEKAEIAFNIENERMIIRSGRIRYSLVTLPASNFPNLDYCQSYEEFTLSQSIFKRAIESTQFSMANQDIRHYLNGMLFETEGRELRIVATDGHRLAKYTILLNETLPYQSIIVPRKGVIELVRMLNERIQLLKIKIGDNNLRAIISNYIFTSKLVNGRFPDYNRVLHHNNSDKILEVECDLLRQAFTRASILSHEKFRSVQLNLSHNQLKITAHNMEQEETEEILDVDYQDRTIVISFNASYILDVLNVLKCKVVRLLLTDETSSVQIEDSANTAAKYVVMPIRM